MVFALSGKRTVIIGADMRRPKIFNDFGLNNDVGLSNYLSGIAPMDSIIRRPGRQTWIWSARTCTSEPKRIDFWMRGWTNWW